MIAVFLALVHLESADAAEPAGATTVAAVAPERLGQYDAVRLALVGDKLDEARAAARELATAAVADPPFAAAAQSLAAASEIGAARSAFGELSRLLIRQLGSATPAPRLVVYHCPMFEGFAWWVQPKAGIANPYMGQAMPECGAETSLKAAAKAAGAP
jgi:enoyl-CoA hydratase/carnithine racemase